LPVQRFSKVRTPGQASYSQRDGTSTRLRVEVPDIFWSWAFLMLRWWQPPMEKGLQSFLSRNGRERVAPLVARGDLLLALSVRRQAQPTGICV